MSIFVKRSRLPQHQVPYSQAPHSQEGNFSLQRRAPYLRGGNFLFGHQTFHSQGGNSSAENFSFQQAPYQGGNISFGHQVSNPRGGNLRRGFAHRTNDMSEDSRTNENTYNLQYLSSQSTSDDTLNTVSQIPSQNFNSEDIYRLETSFDNPILPTFVPRENTSDIDEDRFEQLRGDHYHGNLSEGRNWHYNDVDIHSQHRTTSMHRNVNTKQHVSSRTVPRNLEERRKWVEMSGTSRRAPLVDHAIRIVEYMQQDNSLMEDNPESEQLRKEALRDMPQSLAVKKIIKRKLLKSVGGKRKTLGCGKLLKYKISMWFSQMKTGFKNLSYTFELWYSSLKKIEGNFGSGVSTYFRFLRWLFVLNLLITIICFGFIIVPQIVYQLTNMEATPKSESRVSNDTNTPAVTVTNTDFSVTDLFTGSGYLTNTTLYYGFYINGYINVYSMPDAYFFTMIVLYAATFIILSVSMAKSYQKNFIQTKGGLENVFAHKIFCGWDYSTATGKAADLKAKTIYHELKELLADTKTQKNKGSCLDKFNTWLMQVIVNVLFFSLLGTTGFVMWILLERHRSRVDEFHEEYTIVAILTAVFINIVMVLFPMIFSFIARYEGYKNPRTTVTVSLVRTFLLEIVVVGTLLVYWFTHSDESECWETSIGQEIYRLIVFDFFFSVILITLIESLRFFIYKKFWEQLGPPEFDIARNTLSTIYNQTLFWVGFYFSPFLGVVVIVKLFLTWYIRSIALIKFSMPSTKSWRAAQTQTWFLILTFLSLLLIIGVHGYVMINIPISTNVCGPFRDFQFIHEIFIDNESQIWYIITFVTRPGVIALVIIGMTMVVYYLRAKSKAQVGMVNFLRDRLVLAAKDKEFLLKLISIETKGQWQYQLQKGRDVLLDPKKMAPGGYFTHEQRQDYGDAAVPSTSSDDVLISSSGSSLPLSDISSHSMIPPKRKYH